MSGEGITITIFSVCTVFYSGLKFDEKVTPKAESVDIIVDHVLPCQVWLCTEECQWGTEHRTKATNQHDEPSTEVKKVGMLNESWHHGWVIVLGSCFHCWEYLQEMLTEWQNFLKCLVITILKDRSGLVKKLLIFYKLQDSVLCSYYLETFRLNYQIPPLHLWFVGIIVWSEAKCKNAKVLIKYLLEEFVAYKFAGCRSVYCIPCSKLISQHKL